jgi:cell division protein FtsB
VKTESRRNGAAFRKKIFLLGTACLFLVMVVTAVFGKKGVMDIHRLRVELARLENDVQKLKQDKAELESEILRLEKDPKAVEKTARQELGLIKPGEKVIVIPKAPKK